MSDAIFRQEHTDFTLFLRQEERLRQSNVLSCCVWLLLAPRVTYGFLWLWACLSPAPPVVNADGQIRREVLARLEGAIGRYQNASRLWQWCLRLWYRIDDLEAVHRYGLIASHIAKDGGAEAAKNFFNDFTAQELSMDELIAKYFQSDLKATAIVRRPTEEVLQDLSRYYAQLKEYALEGGGHTDEAQLNQRLYRWLETLAVHSNWIEYPLLKQRVQLIIEESGGLPLSPELSEAQMALITEHQRVWKALAHGTVVEVSKQLRAARRYVQAVSTLLQDYQDFLRQWLCELKQCEQVTNSRGLSTVLTALMWESERYGEPSIVLHFLLNRVFGEIFQSQNKIIHDLFRYAQERVGHASLWQRSLTYTVAFLPEKSKHWLSNFTFLQTLETNDHFVRSCAEALSGSEARYTQYIQSILQGSTILSLETESLPSSYRALWYALSDGSEAVRSLENQGDSVSPSALDRPWLSFVCLYWEEEEKHRRRGFLHEPLVRLTFQRCRATLISLEHDFSKSSNHRGLWELKYRRRLIELLREEDTERCLSIHQAQAYLNAVKKKLLVYGDHLAAVSGLLKDFFASERPNAVFCRAAAHDMTPWLFMHAGLEELALLSEQYPAGAWWVLSLLSFDNFSAHELAESKDSSWNEGQSLLSDVRVARRGVKQKLNALRRLLHQDKVRNRGLGHQEKEELALYLWNNFVQPACDVFNGLSDLMLERGIFVDKAMYAVLSKEFVDYLPVILCRFVTRILQPLRSAPQVLNQVLHNYSVFEDREASGMGRLRLWQSYWEERFSGLNYENRVNQRITDWIRRMEHELPRFNEGIVQLQKDYQKVGLEQKPIGQELRLSTGALKKQNNILTLYCDELLLANEEQGRVRDMFQRRYEEQYQSNETLKKMMLDLCAGRDHDRFLLQEALKRLKERRQSQWADPRSFYLEVSEPEEASQQKITFSV